MYLFAETFLALRFTDLHIDSCVSKNYYWNGSNSL